MASHEADSLSAELERVRHTVQQVQEKFSQEWIDRELRGGLRDTLDKRQADTAQKQEQIVQLQDCLKRLKEDAVTNEKEIQEREKALEEMTEEMEKVKLEVDDLLRKKEQTADGVEGLKKRLAREREYLALQQSTTQSKMEELRKGVQWFGSRMGLELRKTPDSKLQFIFTCIDRDHPKRPFYFSVQIDDTANTYKVSDCNPLVKDLDSLSEKLNQTNDFRSFVVTMRARFKQLI